MLAPPRGDGAQRQGGKLNGSTPILSARGLGKRFGAVVAAQDLSVDIAQGERVSLIGSNGAGKTTFVNMITGYL